MVDCRSGDGYLSIGDFSSIGKIGNYLPIGEYLFVSPGHSPAFYNQVFFNSGEHDNSA